MLTWHLGFLHYSKSLQSKPPNLSLSLTFSGSTKERKERVDLRKQRILGTRRWRQGGSGGDSTGAGCDAAERVAGARELDYGEGRLGSWTVGRAVG